MAIEKDSFQRLLHFLNILSPSDSNVNYWSIQGKETIDSLKSKTAFLKDLIAKVESNVDLNIDDAENLLQLITKRRHNKWMPIRKNLDPGPEKFSKNLFYKSLMLLRIIKMTLTCFLVFNCYLTLTVKF